MLESLAGFLFLEIAAQAAPPLFREAFEDDALPARGWYDGVKFKISPGGFSGACLEYHWAEGATAPESSSGIRRLFEPSATVFLRFYIRLSKDWGWTGRPYHPHMMHFMTTENGKWHGPAASHLTVYVEPWEGRLRLAAQDIQNKDMPRGLTQGPLKGGFNGRMFDSDKVLFSDDAWHLVEAQFSLNSLDGERPRADGVVRAWFDGALVVDRDDVVLRSADFPDMKFNQFLLTPYFGPKLLPRAQTLWIDELAVGTARLPLPAQARPLPVEGAKASLKKAVVEGPRFVAPELFQGHEDFHHPRLRRLREEYKLEDVVRGEESDFRRLLKLRAWVHSRWPIDNGQSFSGDAFAILEKARDGLGFHCAHSMTVQYAVMTAMGHVARNLGTDADHEKFGKSRHHGVNEVWSNEHAKWVLLDAKYDSHFERSGVPLSALEVHDAVRAGKTKDVVTVQGPDRRPVSLGGPESIEASPDNYWWVSWHVRPDSFTQPHWSGGSRLIVPDNEAFRTSVWHRGSANGLVRHWAYAANAFVPVKELRQIEWTPGVPALRAAQRAEDALDVRLQSATPNFSRYELRVQGGAWAPCAERFEWKLEKGENTLELRTRNLFGVAGPVVRARVELAP